MKTLITLLAIFFISITSFAQTGFNYKAVVKDDNGNVVANQDVTMRFSILDALSGGNIESQETHDNVMTDANGIVIANIGEGSQSLSYGFFSEIDWGSHAHFLKVEIDITGGTNFVDMGTTEFKTVPYALYADKVKDQAFKSEDGVTYAENTTDDFVVGSTQLDHTGTSDGTTRMFFDRGKASFRAGRALDEEWDDANVGNRTAAFGLNTIATGTYSVATGNRTLAQARSSLAIGEYNVGGGNPTAWVGTDPLFEIGNGTATISTETRNNALTVLKNGKVGIGYDAETPTQSLDVSGKIKVANDFTTPTPGTIRFNETANAFEGYIAETGWVTLGTKKREKTVVVPATEFVASLVGNMSVGYSSNTVFLSGSTPSSNLPYITAPLVLPVGSKLISISYVFEDNNPSNDLAFIFSKYCGDSNLTLETNTTLNAHVATGIQSTNLHKYTYNINETIQIGCQYVISASSGNNWGNPSAGTVVNPSAPPGVKVHKIYIRYEED